MAAARPYSEHITEVIRNLAAAGASASSPLLQPRENVRTVAYVVLAAVVTSFKERFQPSDAAAASAAEAAS